MIYVSHRLDEIFRIADRVAVLRDGKLVGQKQVAETKPDELIEMIVGRPANQLFAKAATKAGETVCAVRDLVCAGAGPVSFDVRQGELLGLVGLRGAGQELIGRALFGCDDFCGRDFHRRRDAGSLQSRSRRCKSGVGLIARDRTEESIAAVALNPRKHAFSIRARPGAACFPSLARRKEAALARGIGDTVGLRPNDPDLPIEALSGGNQQKVVVGRWLAYRPQAAHRRRPDRRRRCRREGRDLPADRRGPSKLDLRRRRCFDRLRGDRPYLPPGAGLFPRADRSRTRRRRTHDIRRDHRRIGIRSRLTDLEQLTMQSIESTALEPTRGEMTGLPARQKLIRLVPVYGLVILTLC